MGSTEEGSDISLENAHYVYQNAEIGELDTAEDSIDGMGAMKFTDEEDSGYFGTYSLYHFHSHSAILIRLTERSFVKHRLLAPYILCNDSGKFIRAKFSRPVLATNYGHNEYLSPTPCAREGQSGCV